METGRGGMDEDGDLIPVSGIDGRLMGKLPDVDPGKYWPAGEDEGHGRIDGC